MQPYIFPYLGYFQLITAVDVFVFYDDVDYIKGGWINRNAILSPSGRQMFSVPIQKLSSFVEIKETKLHPKQFHYWRKKFLKTLQQNYAKAPYFTAVFNLVETVLTREHTTISEVAIDSVSTVSAYLRMQTEFVESSGAFSSSKGLHRTDRLIEITKQKDGEIYVNLPGGKELYEKSYFEDNGITLKFINNLFEPYQQFSNEFIPGLSIIDVLMFNSIEETQSLLSRYTLS